MNSIIFALHGRRASMTNDTYRTWYTISSELYEVRAPLNADSICRCTFHIDFVRIVIYRLWSFDTRPTAVTMCARFHIFFSSDFNTELCKQ